jgi:carboxypeptidase T
MMQNIYFMYWLFENYNIDPIATYILENRELYFTPVINPDGYEYNRSTNPNGGGMWRKNRKLNSGIHLRC